MAPFQFQYILSRRHRLVTELFPWAPAIAGGLGFTIGIALLAVDVSPLFLFFLLAPLMLYRGLFVLLFDLAIHSGLAVEVAVEDSTMRMRIGRKQLSLPIGGIIQVFREGNAWTVLHYNGPILTIPIEAITDEQIDYLKSFASNAAAERKAAQSER